MTTSYASHADANNLAPKAEWISPVLIDLGTASDVLSGAGANTESEAAAS